MNWQNTKLQAQFENRIRKCEKRRVKPHIVDQHMIQWCTFLSCPVIWKSMPHTRCIIFRFVMESTQRLFRAHFRTTYRSQWTSSCNRCFMGLSLRNKCFAKISTPSFWSSVLNSKLWADWLWNITSPLKTVTLVLSALSSSVRPDVKIFQFKSQNMLCQSEA